MKTSVARAATDGKPMPGFQDPETYRTILESLQTGICVVDLRRRILLWSDGAEQITGYLRHEVVGHECVDNMLPHCNQAGCELCGDHCPLNAATRDFKPVESLGFLHHKSGHRTPVHMWSAPARDARGSIIGVIQSFYNQRYVPSPDRRDGNRGSWVDAATGVANQAMMHSHLRENLGTFAELSVPFAVVCVRWDEQDHFRANYGPEATSSALQVVAQTLENSLRPTDFVGRWGEDQFLAILTACTEDGLPAVCERIRRMVESGGITWWGNELPVGGISLGSALVQTGDTFESLMARAEQGLAERSCAKKAASAGTGGQSSSARD
jgi:diguanylate cyclase (GGDEF)-like protein/PAS domain S-box-containing protein